MKNDYWVKIRELADDADVEINICIKPMKQVRVVIDDETEVRSFISGWNNILLEEMEKICAEFKAKHKKEQEEINNKLKEFEKGQEQFPDHLFTQ